MTNLNMDTPEAYILAAEYPHDHSNHSSYSSTTTSTSLSSSCTSSTCHTSFSDSDLSEGVSNYDTTCPYVLGFATTAMGHEPPEPFGARYTTEYPERSVDTDVISQAELCFSYAPLPGRDVPDHTKTFTITSIIRTGVNSGPQLVVVNHNLVAKIYDPLYYDSRHGSDVVACADRAYSREASAYSHLQRFPEVLELVPEFHGSWTIQVRPRLFATEQPAKRTRTVRLILIESLNGQCMADVNAEDLSEHVRSSILKQCINAEIRLVRTGLLHRDFVPRNILLLGLESGAPSLHVKVIDFGSSEILTDPNYKRKCFAWDMARFHQKWAPKLMNPLKRYFGQLGEFADFGWCPEEPYEANKWLWKMFGNDTRYISMKWDLQNRRALPKYVNCEGETDDSDFE